MFDSIVNDPTSVGLGAAVVLLIQGGVKAFHIVLRKLNGKKDCPPAPVVVAKNNNGCSSREGVCRQHGERLSALETSTTAFAEDLRVVQTDVKSIDRNVERLLTLSERRNNG